MATIKEGVDYEITATDKTGETVAAVSKTAVKAAGEVGDAAEKAGKKAVAAFSPLKALGAALRGNFAAAAQEMGKLGAKSTDAANKSAKAWGAAGAALTSMITLFKAIRELVNTIFPAMVKDVVEAETKLYDLKNAAAGFADEMARARENSERQTRQFEAQENALNKLAKAQAEMARAQELAAATTDAERDEINARYDREGAELDNATAGRLRDRRRSDLEAEGRRLEAELAQAEKTRDDARATGIRMGRAMRREAGGMGVAGTMWDSLKTMFTGGPSIDEKVGGYHNAAADAWNLADEQESKIEDIQKRIKENRHALAMADLEEEAAKAEESADTMKRTLEDRDRELAEAAKIEEANAKEAAELARQEAQARAEAEKAAAAEAHRLRLGQIAEEKAAWQSALQERNDAEKRLAAARGEVAKAWGWYRNKDSMRAQIEEERAEADARVQFEKDFEKLRFRRDWRTAKNLSVDDEAVRRVALAREQEHEAEQAALETAEQARRAADSLENIEAALTED